MTRYLFLGLIAAVSLPTQMPSLYAGTLSIKAVDEAEVELAGTNFTYDLFGRVSERAQPRRITLTSQTTTSTSAADPAGPGLISINIDEALFNTNEREAIVSIKGPGTETVVVQFLLKKETHNVTLVFRQRVSAVRVSVGNELIAAFSNASSQFLLRGQVGTAFYTDPVSRRKLIQGLQYERSDDRYTYYSEGDATGREWAFSHTERLVHVIRNGCLFLESRGFPVWYRERNESKFRFFGGLTRTLPDSISSDQ